MWPFHLLVDAQAPHRLQFVHERFDLTYKGMGKAQSTHEAIGLDKILASIRASHLDGRS